MDQPKIPQKIVGGVHLVDALTPKQYGDSLLKGIWEKSADSLQFDKESFDSQIEEGLSIAERGFVRFICISDTHNEEQYFDLPKADVLIHSGDFTKFGWPHEVKSFTEWLATQDYLHKIVIAGNHEFTFDIEYEEILKERNKDNDNFPKEADFKETKAILTGCTYLENETIDLYGYKLYGTPCSLQYSKSGFQRPHEEREAFLDTIPEDTDLLITHGPPKGFGSLLWNGNDGGDEKLADVVLNKIKPIIHQFGHIHEAYGLDTGSSGTVFMNASNCMKGQQLDYPAFIFDLPVRPNQTT